MLTSDAMRKLQLATLCTEEGIDEALTRWLRTLEMYQARKLFADPNACDRLKKLGPAIIDVLRPHFNELTTQEGEEIGGLLYMCFAIAAPTNEQQMVLAGAAGRLAQGISGMALANELHDAVTGQGAHAPETKTN